MYFGKACQGLSASIRGSHNGGTGRPCLLFRSPHRKEQERKFRGQLGSDIRTASTDTGSHHPGSLLNFPETDMEPHLSLSGKSLMLEYCLTVFVIVFLYKTKTVTHYKA